MTLQKPTMAANLVVAWHCLCERVEVTLFFAKISLVVVLSLPLCVVVSESPPLGSIPSANLSRSAMPTKLGQTMVLPTTDSPTTEPAVEGVHWWQAPNEHGRQCFYCMLGSCSASEAGYSVLSSLNRHLKPKHLKWVFPEEDGVDGSECGRGVGSKISSRSKQTKRSPKQNVKAAAPRTPVRKRAKTAVGARAPRKNTRQNSKDKVEQKADDHLKVDDNPTKESRGRGNKKCKAERPPVVPGAEEVDGFSFGSEGEEVHKQAHHIRIPICNLNTVAYKSEANKGGSSQTFEASWNQFESVSKTIDGASFASFPIFYKSPKVMLFKKWNQLPRDKVDTEDRGKKKEASKAHGPESMDWSILRMEDLKGGGGQEPLVNYSSDSDEEELLQA